MRPTGSRLRWSVLALVLLTTIPPSAVFSASAEAPFGNQLTIFGPVLVTLCSSSSSYPAKPPNIVHAWYESVLTQQQIIAGQMDELRGQFERDLLGTHDLLERLDFLLEKADRLYAEWKKTGWPLDETVRYGSFTGELFQQRRDLAIGRSINYLRLSLINLSLGYSDSNGSLIEAAEGQEALAKLWRTRSLLFLRNLDS